MKPHLILKPDGKLYCAFIEDEPINISLTKDGEDSFKHEWREWKQQKAEDIANALPVVNPYRTIKLMKSNSGELQYEIISDLLRMVVEVGELYPWNGEAEQEVFSIDKGTYWEDHLGVRLSLQ